MARNGFTEEEMDLLFNTCEITDTDGAFTSILKVCKKIKELEEKIDRQEEENAFYRFLTEKMIHGEVK